MEPRIPTLKELEEKAADRILILGWEQGFTAACKQFQIQREDPTHPITRTNPFKEESK